MKEINAILISAFVMLCFSIGWAQEDDLMEYELILEKQDSDSLYIFDNFDFESGDYKLYATFWRNEWGESFADTLGIFYVEERALLNEIKNDWYFPETWDAHECGYHYVFYLTYKDSIMKELHLNIECNSLVEDSTSYVFNVEKLRKLHGRVSNLEKIEIRSDNRQDAISKLDSLARFTDVFIPKKDKYLWYAYKGYFYFTYRMATNARPEIDSVTQMLEHELKFHFPNDKYTLESRAYGIGNYTYRLYCEEGLYKRFNLYAEKMNYRRFEYFTIVAYREMPNTKK